MGGRVANNHRGGDDDRNDVEDSDRNQGRRAVSVVSVVSVVYTLIGGIIMTNEKRKRGRPVVLKRNKASDGPISNADV